MKTKLAQRYEAEWCSSIPVDDNGDPIMDAAVMEIRHFATLDEAKAFAWKLLREQGDTLPWQAVRIEFQERGRYDWDRLDIYEITEDGEEPYRL